MREGRWFVNFALELILCLWVQQCTEDQLFFEQILWVFRQCFSCYAIWYSKDWLGSVFVEISCSRRREIVSLSWVSVWRRIQQCGMQTQIWIS